MNLLEAQLTDCYKELQKEAKHVRVWVTAAVMFAIPWSVAGLLDTASRVKFDTFFRVLLSGKDPEPSHAFPETFPPKMECAFPPEGSVFDFYYEMKGRGAWKHWNELVRGFETPTHSDIRRIIVPTVDTARWGNLEFSFF